MSGCHRLQYTIGSNDNTWPNLSEHQSRRIKHPLAILLDFLQVCASNLSKCCSGCTSSTRHLKSFPGWFQVLMSVSRYTQGMWELKSVVVLSNAQLYEEGLPICLRVRERIQKGLSIYSRVREINPDGRSIYLNVSGRAKDPWNVVLTNNDSSYI